MSRWLLLCLLCVCCAWLTPAIALEIISMPTSLGDSYDLNWDMLVKAPLSCPLLLGVEQTDAGGGYLLRVTNTQAVWERLDKPGVPLLKATLTLPTGNHAIFTIKRRPDTLAVLLNHRLLFCTPAPMTPQGTLEFRQVPPDVVIDSPRYRSISRIVFGDDFMRPESMTHLLVNPNSWVEDDTWKVAYYRKDNPGSDPKDPKTGKDMVTPWQLSIYNPLTSSNGFWFLYWGSGPSWVVANPTMSYPFWDQYFLEAAVRTEYDSEVGIIAAYQDNKNYLLFRWRQREYTPSTAAKAELVAVINGEQKVLASSPRGFDPMQWYQLRINLGWKHVQALIDGEVVLEADNPGAIEGRVGLYVNGADKPSRPKVDDVTASMYVIQDDKGHTVNDAADAMRTNSLVLFDNVRVGSWLSAPTLLSGGGYPKVQHGKWATEDGVLEARAAASSYYFGPLHWSRYVTTAHVKIAQNGSAGLYFDQNLDGTGYLWVATPSGQQLLALDNAANTRKEVAHNAQGLSPDDWHTMRVEADGPYVTAYLDDQLMMERYDGTRASGRCALYAPVRGLCCDALSMTQMEVKLRRKVIIDSFSKDRWLVTWSSPEADWYPGFTPRAFVTPSGLPHSMIGPAAPLPTDQAGIYWQKGGHYHDLRVTIPFSRDQLSGQILHLAANYDEKGGYRVVFGQDKDQGTATLQRSGVDLQVYHFQAAAKDPQASFNDAPPPPRARFVFERRGSYLLLRVQDLDPAGDLDSPVVTNERLIFAYQDRAPLKVSMIGFTVTTPSLPAAQVLVESDRVEDTFHAAPTGWITQSGVWAVMARYSCQPQWNWFGGFGVNTPTVWSKYRLDGDQTAEAYLGVKMQYDNIPEEEARRFRDMAITICADGSHLNTGYTLIRAGRLNGQSTTFLLRKGVVVKTSTNREDLLPSNNQGHREWFVTRLEKRGAELKVYLDNHLAMTYADPDPLPGGYMAIWTLNNGVMIGRANYSAEQMTLGTPHATSPLAVEQPLPTAAPLTVSLNNTPLPMSTFASGLEGWKERPGLTARVLREQVNDPVFGAMTCLRAINMYPAGDFSVSASTTLRDLATTPWLHVDYCFDAGAQINLYVHKDDTWYELPLTGTAAVEQPDIMTVDALHGVADGKWHHLDVDLSDVLQRAVIKRHGEAPGNLSVQEIVFADWTTTPDMRAYGCGNNPGGMAARFANYSLTPLLKDAATIQWAGDGYTGWRMAVDANPLGVPTTAVEENKTTIPFKAGLRFLHLQGKDTAGNWGVVMHIPLSGK